ncbi:MAG: hypothetical protein F4051_07295 [Boseongicola sp. SB0670_bin_30]|nr:hypothetical protein [Boseongicola sp. SB0670_bin_30]
MPGLWSRMRAGTREDGSGIKANDPGWCDQTPAAVAARLRPVAWLEQRDIRGTLVEEPGYAEALEEWLGVIRSGARQRR